MNILLWTQYFWPETFHINQLVISLQKLGLKINVLTGKPNYPEGNTFYNYRSRGVQYEDYFGMEIVRIPLIPRKKNSLLQLTMNYVSFIFFGALYAPFLLRRKKFDVVFVYGLSPILQALPAILLSKIKHIPLVLWVQDIWPEALISTGYVKNRFILGCVTRLVQYIYHHSDAILIQSEAFRESIQDLTDEPGKIHFYPNTVVEPELESPPSHGDQEIALISLMQKHFSIVFTGNMGKVQGWQTILQAAELLIKYEKIHFFLVGSGSMFKRVEEEIQQRQLTNVSLKAQLPYASMPGIYAAASALLITLNAGDNLDITIPSKLSGYLSAGKPIIASLNGETARIINEAKAGFTGPAEDGEALAQNILHLFSRDVLEREELGNNGKKYFKQHFELNAHAKKLAMLLQKIIEDYHQGVKH